MTITTGPFSVNDVPLNYTGPLKIWYLIIIFIDYLDESRLTLMQRKVNAKKA